MGGAGNGSSDGINSTIAMATNLTSIVREKVHNPCYDIQHYDMCCSDGEEEMCTPVHMAVAACMMAGILQIVMGFLNFGFVVDYIGFTVLNGESCTRFGRDMSLLTRICLASDYTARAVSIQGSTERACCCYMYTSSLNTACGWWRTHSQSDIIFSIWPTNSSHQGCGALRTDSKLPLDTDHSTNPSCHATL